MRDQSLLKRYAYATVTCIALTGLGTTTQSQDLPSYMGPISGRTVSSPADAVVKNVLALNVAMFELYDDAAKIFQGNIPSFSACSRGRAVGLFFIDLAWRHSRHHRSLSSIN
jgi:hypothetical protein